MVPDWLGNRDFSNQGKDKEVVDTTPLTEDEVRKIADETFNRVYSRTFEADLRLHEALKNVFASQSTKEFQSGITVLVSIGRAWSLALAKMLSTYEIIQARHTNPNIKKTFDTAIKEMREEMEATMEEGRKAFIPIASTLEQLSRDKPQD